MQQSTAAAIQSVASLRAAFSREQSVAGGNPAYSKRPFLFNWIASATLLHRKDKPQRPLRSP
jgi:hypothetical protein